MQCEWCLSIESGVLPCTQWEADFAGGGWMMHQNPQPAGFEITCICQGGLCSVTYLSVRESRWGPCMADWKTTDDAVLVTVDTRLLRWKNLLALLSEHVSNNALSLPSRSLILPNYLKNSNFVLFFNWILLDTVALQCCVVKWSAVKRLLYSEVSSMYTRIPSFWNFLPVQVSAE